MPKEMRSDAHFYTLLFGFRGSSIQFIERLRQFLHQHLHKTAHTHHFPF